MRVSMSAIGSCMLIWLSLPARLDDAGHLALERQVAQLVATQPEHAVDATRTARQGAAIAQTHGRGVARQLLQLEPRLFLRLFGGPHVVDDLEQLGASRLVLGDGLDAFFLTEDESKFGHVGYLSA